MQRALAMGRKDVLDTDLAVGGLVDEPVVPLTKARAPCALVPSAPIAQVERFTDAVGHLPEASDTLRRGCVEHIVKSGKIAPQAVPNLILSLHGGHGSEVVS